jgi:hypothetical protein
LNRLLLALIFGLVALIWLLIASGTDDTRWLIAALPLIAVSVLTHRRH